VTAQNLRLALRAVGSVRWRQLGEGKTSSTKALGNWLLEQKHPRRMALSDRCVEV